MARSLLVCLSLAIPAAPSAIVRRHDRPDSSYRALGEKFPAVTNFGRAGEGTLVTPQWMITAAHVAAGMRKDIAITFGDQQYQIETFVVHPDWKEMGPKDIALVKLSRPVAGITPLPFYTSSDEAGKDVVFVGHGGTGTGETGPLREEDGLKRGATNRVDRVDEDWLYFSFDSPPAGSDLEGISGPGDSGGPALLEVNGVSYVAGISVWGNPGARGRGTYGATEGYTRVSSHAVWIKQVIGKG